MSESRDEQEVVGEDSEQELPPFDFNLLVLSLTTSALIHLGEAPDASVSSGEAK